MANKTVAAPKGFHWMKSGKTFKLMKGEYKPHPGAVKEHHLKYKKYIVKGVSNAI